MHEAHAASVLPLRFRASYVNASARHSRAERAVAPMWLGGPWLHGVQDAIDEPALLTKQQADHVAVDCF